MIRRHFDSRLKQNLRVWTVHKQSWRILFLRSKEQRNASCNHQQLSATILKYIDALFFSTWFYHVTLSAGSPRARAKSSKFYSSSMIYKRKITMWRNFLSVWFFMQHERWAFIYIILFRAHSIFVHRNCGSVSKSIRLLFRLHCMLMLRYGWCEFYKFQNLVTDQWLI